MSYFSRTKGIRDRDSPASFMSTNYGQSKLSIQPTNDHVIKDVVMKLK